jgi:hypothetical protein
MLVERYRNHLIFVKAEQDPGTALWKAGTHVQFNEDPRTFRDVWLPRPAVGSKTKRIAERQMIKEARKWVDDRLSEVNQATVKTLSLGSRPLTGEQTAPGNSQEEQESSPRES